ncbi:PREDICTED: nucleolin 2-like [Camelina sativa]|uniref:Nucleolin 2-like n=1 Tax=Camelina sativa TaxID=90675 RepID=A0ABM0WI52_CAMSA|nr:PREDICTED: nucleolin 2-like [Camelina sativa]
MPPKTTKTDVLAFLQEKGQGPVVKVKLVKQKAKEDENAMAGYVVFKSHSDAKKAVELNGELMSFKNSKSRHVYVTRTTNSRRTIFVSGFKSDLAEDDIRKQLKEILAPKVIKVFLPKDLGFAYVLLSSMTTRLKKAVKKGSIIWNGDKIYVRDVRLQEQFMKAKEND